MSEPKPLSPAQVKAFLDYIQDSNGTEAKRLLGVRNHLIALLMLDAGCRENEVRQLTIADLYFHNQPRQSIQIRPQIAKYKSGGLIPTSSALQAALAAYARACPLDPANHMDDLAFPAGHNHQPITTRQIRRIIGKAGHIALTQRVHPHLLRHTFGDSLRTVADIGTRMRLMRHKDVRSTMVYDHPDDQAKADAIAAMERHRKQTTP